MGFFGTGGGILLSWTGMTNSLNDRPLSPHGELQLNKSKEQHNYSQLLRKKVRRSGVAVVGVMSACNFE